MIGRGAVAAALIVALAIPAVGPARPPPGAAELERAKAYLLGVQAMDRRTNARHAWYLAFFEVVGAGWEFPERYARAVESVTAADVRVVAERMLNRPTVVVVQPR